MRVGIIVGHTKINPGAASFDNSDNEYNYNNNLAKKISFLLLCLGYECSIFLKDGVFKNELTKKINALNCDCTIELHCNASNGLAIGTETLFIKNHIYSHLLAEIINNDLIFILNRKNKENRGVKTIEQIDRGYKNLFGLISPACLIEPFFIDNEDDYNLGINNIDSIANSIVNSLILFENNYLINNSIN